MQSGVQRTFDPDRLVEESILNSVVTVTLKEFLAACQAGNAGVPERLVGAIKRRRIVTTGLCGAGCSSGSDGDDEHESGYGGGDEAGGPIALGAEEEEDIFEAKAYHARLPAAELPACEEHRHLLPGRAAAIRLMWARPVSETRIFVPGLDREVRALIDSGSEVNLAERWLAEAAGWQMMLRPGWTIHTATGHGSVGAACANVRLGIASFITKHHLFVQDEIGYPLVLGQPWRARLRYSSGWKEDGSEMGQVTSPDGEKTVRFSVVNPADERHRLYLKKKLAYGPGPEGDTFQYEDDHLGANPEEEHDEESGGPGFLRGRL